MKMRKLVKRKLKATLTRMKRLQAAGRLLKKTITDRYSSEMYVHIFKNNSNKQEDSRNCHHGEAVE